GVALAGQRLRRRAARDPRRRRALAIAALASKVREAKGKSSAEAAARLGELVRSAVGLRYDIDVEGHPAHEALERAWAAGAKKEDMAEVKELLESLDRLAFAPPGSQKRDGRTERKAVEGLLRRYREAFE